VPAAVRRRVLIRRPTSRSDRQSGFVDFGTDEQRIRQQNIGRAPVFLRTSKPWRRHRWTLATLGLQRSIWSGQRRSARSPTSPQKIPPLRLPEKLLPPSQQPLWHSGRQARLISHMSLSLICETCSNPLSLHLRTAISFCMHTRICYRKQAQYLC